MYDDRLTAGQSPPAGGRCAASPPPAAGPSILICKYLPDLLSNA
jgi:hypothetical protein